MIAEPTEKLNGRHIGRNVQRVRMYFGMKQEALASDLGISQAEVSKIEQQEEIEDDMLTRIAGVLGVSPEIIRDFDVERAIYNISNIRENTFEQGSSTSIAQRDNASVSFAQQINPLDKIVELYERLLQSEREKNELLRNGNQ
ncbi:MAG: helix-turn-helix transcriptional regulator [Proteiniphilum sp.]|jgi:transcriptional regulator with XRE-family HTH domain|nr:helix-turn-helix transcriptional regulator [Proteiniphilum sp.]MDD3969304.1 helix-turn-helix transcriptional regulator [Proteiniphilum sp.]MDD4800761.1 helix-turn-helix transcriptional regulator [Proteiniphilum sp.]